MDNLPNNYRNELSTSNLDNEKHIYNHSNNSSIIGISEYIDEVVTEAGQKRCGPPKNWSIKSPGKGCEVFIAKIPKELDEINLIILFKSIGPIYMFRLMMENEQVHRGFGFCIYTCPEHAKEAVARLNNYQVKANWFIGVCFSVDNCRLFVGGIPKQKKKGDIYEEMTKVTDNVIDVIVYPSAADKSKNRGFAFIEYQDHKSASIARKKMINNSVQLWGHKVAVDWAEPERKVDAETMAQVKILYIRNLQLSTSEEMIFNKFSAHTAKDEIVRVRKLGDFAFVHFQNRDQAEIVREKMDGIELDGSQIEVHFAKPVNRIEQQQKLMRNSMSLMMNNKDLDKLNVATSNLKITGSPETGKSFRNAAGRCSLKSKQIMKHFDANRDIISNNFTALLTQICQQNNWGTPYFSVQMIPLVFPTTESSTFHMFVSQVYIPGLNCHFPSKSGAFNHEEAILSASENALQWMFYNGIQIPLLLGPVAKQTFKSSNPDDLANSDPNISKQSQQQQVLSNFVSTSFDSSTNFDQNLQDVESYNVTTDDVNNNNNPQTKLPYPHSSATNTNPIYFPSQPTVLCDPYAQYLNNLYLHHPNTQFNGHMRYFSDSSLVQDASFNNDTKENPSLLNGDTNEEAIF